jgi:UDP-N-acetylenolpyruvoylglucosamine reductase
MSDGNATWQDLIALMTLAQARILAQFALPLEPEVRIIRA